MNHFEMLAELTSKSIKVSPELDLSELKVVIKVYNKDELIQTDNVKFDENFYPYFKSKVEKIYKYFKNK